MERTKIIKYNNKLYALLDEVEYKGITYYNALEVVDNKLTQSYAIIKKYMKNGNEMCSYVTEPKELVGSLKLLLNNVAKETKDVLLPEGSIFTINDRQYMNAAYIPLKGNIYMVLVCAKPVVDVMVAKVMSGKNEANQMELQDATGTDEGIAVLKAHSMIFAESK